jgi:hypothetical protein
MAAQVLQGGEAVNPLAPVAVAMLWLCFCGYRAWVAWGWFENDILPDFRRHRVHAYLWAIGGLIGVVAITQVRP